MTTTTDRKSKRAKENSEPGEQKQRLDDALQPQTFVRDDLCELSDARGGRMRLGELGVLADRRER